MYKVNINFVLLLAVGVCFHCGLGRRVSLDDGNFNVSWMYSRESDELYFEVEVYAEGWVGFGFTFTPEEMRNYDLVIGGQTDTGESYFNVSDVVFFTLKITYMKQIKPFSFLNVVKL